jgi:hypothetical protein
MSDRTLFLGLSATVAAMGAVLIGGICWALLAAAEPLWKIPVLALSGPAITVIGARLAR